MRYLKKFNESYLNIKTEPILAKPKSVEKVRMFDSFHLLLIIVF